MRNEIALLISLIISFGGLLLFFISTRKAGVYAWISFVTIAANIEVMMLIRAFGMEQTLGNTLFAASYLATDILSELWGKKESKTGVIIGIFSDIVFISLTLLWMQFTPSESDWATPHIKALFSNTPRLMIASLTAYTISELHDVWAYHFWWNLTTKKTGNRDRMLWVRNNASTLTSQLINIVLFTLLAFWGVYPGEVLVSITISGYVIYICTSLLDTPFIYLVRYIHRRGEAAASQAQ